MWSHGPHWLHMSHNLPKPQVMNALYGNPQSWRKHSLNLWMKEMGAVLLALELGAKILSQVGLRWTMRQVGKFFAERRCVYSWTAKEDDMHRWRRIGVSNTNVFSFFSVKMFSFLLESMPYSQFVIT